MISPPYPLGSLAPVSHPTDRASAYPEQGHKEGQKEGATARLRKHLDDAGGVDALLLEDLVAGGGEAKRVDAEHLVGVLVPAGVTPASTATVLDFMAFGSTSSM